MGLMLQRIMTASLLIFSALTHIQTPLEVDSAGPHFFDAMAGLLILLGLWTPVVGAIVAARELWIVFFGTGDPWIPLVMATFGSSLAMIGPGAWSLDARLFGRRQIKGPR